MTAERELAALYEAVCRKYGPKEGKKAAQDWIEELETMAWPVDGGLPDWRRVTTSLPIALPPESSTTLGVDDGQCGEIQFLRACWHTRR
jgi:hypothetical protein